MKYLQGTFVPANPSKYSGDVTKIYFRSSWEKKAMVFFDNNPSILKWSSEEVIVPYISPIDGKQHRYFPDFLIMVKTIDGTINRIMVEIKPAIQCSPPKQGKKTKRMITEMHTFMVNQAKWIAAKSWCDRNNMKFQIITEKELGIKK